MGKTLIQQFLISLNLLVFSSASCVLAQENDPRLENIRPKIEYCAHKLIPGVEPESPLFVFIDELRAQIGLSEITRDEIYEWIKMGFAREYFHEQLPPPKAEKPFYEQDDESEGNDPMLTPKEEPKYGLPPGIKKWSDLLKLDDCLDFVKNVGIPKSEWDQKCIEIKMPKTLADLKSIISIKDEIELLKYLHRSDHKTSRINGFIEKDIYEKFKKELIVGHYAMASIQKFEKKSAEFYKHFASEIPVVDKYWRHPKALKKFNPEKLNRTLWNVTHIIPSYPGYLSQKMIVDEKGITGPTGGVMQLKFGVYDSGDSTQPFTNSRLPHWSKSGVEKNVEYLGYNPGPNGNSDVDSLSLSIYAYLDDPRSDLIEFNCYVVGEPPQRLVCSGKTKTLANPAQPYSQAVKGKNAFIMIFTRDQSI